MRHSMTTRLFPRTLSTYTPLTCFSWFPLVIPFSLRGQSSRITVCRCSTISADHLVRRALFSHGNISPLDGSFFSSISRQNQVWDQRNNEDGWWKSKSSETRDLFKYCMLVFCVLGMTQSYALGQSKDRTEKVEKLRAELKGRLDHIRTKLQRKFPQFRFTRPVTVSISNQDTICVSFPLLHHTPISYGLIVNIVKALVKDEDETVRVSCIGQDLGFTFPDSSGSVLLQYNGESQKNGELLFFKDGEFSNREIDMIIESYEQVLTNSVKCMMLQTAPRTLLTEPGTNHQSTESPSEKLTQLGAKVFSQAEDEQTRTWDELAGYQNVKRDIEDTILLSVKHPEVYNQITKQTRETYEKSKVRAVLFEGPPGCGKTSTARILSSIAGMPMVYIPIEAVMSKFFGESENKLKEIFETCEKLGPCIVFLDEIDSLATSRDVNTMHEATRRILSVLLRSLDGFENSNNSVLIAATNRKDDLDSALISRFNLSIAFDLPDKKTRRDIFRRYAKQLPIEALDKLANSTHNFSGRDIKDVCELAERRWASKRIRKIAEALNRETPSSLEYENAVETKASSFSDASQQYQSAV